jgi:uncharacterized lipoprotein YajG
MNKIQKTIAILLIIVAVVLVAGCANKAPATENKTPAAVPAEKHPDQSKEWMQVTSADALNVSNAANALMSASLDGVDSQKITNLMEEVKTSNNKTQQKHNLILS